ncbi:unnamed protein product [Tuber melanosporum]|uniref:(Perigord truffle) hypothetical protein n=1 Tax=Tuber melanosporum (strain Mel28) TaxID=656061 RepID=D5G4Q3_TUBMM|nr:uncharacterized protein GSTUM_00000039001 [Tuber melanosporum]CAZ79489.1 unnamed protein product [Tuber melanosporum]
MPMERWKYLAARRCQTKCEKLRHIPKDKNS